MWAGHNAKLMNAGLLSSCVALCMWYCTEDAENLHGHSQKCVGVAPETEVLPKTKEEGQAAY